MTQRLTMVKPFKPTSSRVRNPKTCADDVTVVRWGQVVGGHVRLV